MLVMSLLLHCYSLDWCKPQLCGFMVSVCACHRNSVPYKVTTSNNILSEVHVFIVFNDVH